MNMQIEQTESGKRYVLMSRSGRKYTGATMEEAERKAILAELYARQRGIGKDIAAEMCAALFAGVVDYVDLTIEQLRTLRNEFRNAQQYGKELEKSQRLEPGASALQRRKLIRLGKYVLGPVYGEQWFWKKLHEWVPRLKYAKRIELDDLTSSEAYAVIKRMERIEKKLGERNGATTA